MIPRTPLVLIALFLTAGLCHYFDKPFDTGLVEDIKKAPFDHEAAVREMNFLSAEEHPFGSPRQKTLADHIVSVLSKQGFPAILQPLEVKTPNPQAFVRSGAPVNPVVKVTGQNIVVRTAPFFKKQPECVVLLASHYDSKSVAGVSYVGANDGGSSSVALLALLPLIRDLIVHHPMQCELIAVWFDGEESILPEWDDGRLEHPTHSIDHTYGSQFLADHLAACKGQSPGALCLPDDLGGGRLVALILLDMIGSPHLALTRDLQSEPALLNLLSAADKALFGASILGDAGIAVNDDHVPFRERSIPALDIIDFNHLEYWHRAGDTPEHIAFSSIERAARLAALVGAAVASHPELSEADGAFAP